MKLADWIDQAKGPDGKPLRRYVFASRIGVTPVMITAYCNGETWPGRKVMEAIARETGGEVTANDFVHMQAAE